MVRVVDRNRPAVLGVDVMLRRVHDIPTDAHVDASAGSTDNRQAIAALDADQGGVLVAEAAGDGCERSL